MDNRRLTITEPIRDHYTAAPNPGYSDPRKCGMVGSFAGAPGLAPAAQIPLVLDAPDAPGRWQATHSPTGLRYQFDVALRNGFLNARRYNSANDRISPWQSLWVWEDHAEWTRIGNLPGSSDGEHDAARRAHKPVVVADEELLKACGALSMECRRVHRVGMTMQRGFESTAQWTLESYFIARDVLTSPESTIVAIRQQITHLQSIGNAV